MNPDRQRSTAPGIVASLAMVAVMFALVGGCVVPDGGDGSNLDPPRPEPTPVETSTAVAHAWRTYAAGHANRARAVADAIRDAKAAGEPLTSAEVLDLWNQHVEATNAALTLSFQNALEAASPAAQEPREQAWRDISAGFAEVSQ